MYREAAARFESLPAFSTKNAKGVFEPISFRDLYETGMALATALIDLGLRPREHVGMLADNRLEWILCDYGILLAGAADVPRGADVTDTEIRYIIDHSDARFVCVENLKLLEKFQACRADLPRVEKVILMDRSAVPPEGVLALADLIEKGRSLRAAGDRRAEERSDAVTPEDLFTIIYTSGTTGVPKGVPLTHANMASQVKNLPFDLEPGWRALSILPVWHSYERVFEMVAISMGVNTHYTTIRAIGEDLKTVEPNVMASAPRLWESLYLKLMARIDAAPKARQTLFKAARGSTCRVKRAVRFFKGQELDTTGRSFSENFGRGIRHAANFIALYLPYLALDKIVLSKLRQAVGCTHFRGTISGGGALQPHVDEFFNFIGIPVLEGYGLTETSPVLAVRTWDDLVIGTVGPLYPETEVRIIDLGDGSILYPDPSRKGEGRGLRGEIHVRGPQVMHGYYKDPENTARVLRDGWFNTGDIGMVTFNNCLKILGRSKETIVLLNGENIEPTPIEHRINESPLVDQCIVTGQDMKQLSALIVPSVAGFAAAGIEAKSLADLAANPAAAAAMEAEIRQRVCAATGFKPFERISQFRFLTKPFEPGDELTRTFKMRRHIIADKYAGLIAEMYPEAQGPQAPQSRQSPKSSVPA